MIHYSFKSILSAFFVTTLMGCMVGPNFTKPLGPETDTYLDQDPTSTVQSVGRSGQSQKFIKNQDIPAKWWELFHSPELNCLIEKGLKNSPNLKAAQATLNEASANLQAGIGLLLPNISATGGGLRQRASAASLGSPAGIQPKAFNLYNASVNVNYPIDFFGGSRRQIEGLSAIVDYQYFIYQATYLTLAANIATTAITEASIRSQIQATKELIDLNQQQLDIISKQYDLGGVSHTDVLTQQTAQALLQASLPQLEKNLSQARHALSMLIGELPSEDCLPSFSLDTLHLPENLPISVPSRLVQQRPDIQAASALLHQASAQIGVATANMLPQLSITGSSGFLSGSFSHLFTPKNIVWNIGGQATQTLFAGGSLYSKRKAANAAYKAAYEQYKSKVLVAFQNVADSLKALEWDAKYLQAQTIAERSAKETLSVSQRQYQLGSVGFLQVLTANQQYIQTRIGRIQAEALRYADTIALFQSLGGGWWQEEDECEE